MLLDRNTYSDRRLSSSVSVTILPCGGRPMVPAPTTQQRFFPPHSTQSGFLFLGLGGRQFIARSNDNSLKDNSVMTVIMFMRCVTAGIALHSAATLKAGLPLVPAAEHKHQLTTSFQENCCVINATSLSQYMHAGVGDTHWLYLLNTCPQTVDWGTARKVGGRGVGAREPGGERGGMYLGGPLCQYG